MKKADLPAPLGENIMGVDVGGAGGIAIVDPTGKLLHVEQLPKLRMDSRLFRTRYVQLVNCLASTFKVGALYYEKQWAGVFMVNGVPVRQSWKGTTNYARQVGFLLGVMAPWHVEIVEVIPQNWKKQYLHGIKDTKLGAVQLAKQRWPEHDALFSGRVGSHVADACWLALYGAEQGLHRMHVLPRSPKAGTGNRVPRKRKSPVRNGTPDA